MRQAKRVVLIMLAVLAVQGTSAFASARKVNSLLVVPARSTIVQFAFDIVALRGVSLVSYEKGLSGGAVLYWWNWVASQWQAITTDELADYSFLKTRPDKVYLLGLDRDITPDLAEALAGEPGLVRIKTLNIVQVVNLFNENMRFTQPEWEALARRHNFKIKDWNYDLRRWGRYGPPGSTHRSRTYRAVVNPSLAQEVSPGKTLVAAEKYAQSEVAKSGVSDKVVNSATDLKLESPAGSRQIENPFEEMERELDRMSKSKAAKGLEMEPVAATERSVKKREAAPVELLKPEEKKPEIDKSDLVPLDLPQDADFIRDVKGAVPAPEDK